MKTIAVLVCLAASIAFADAPCAPHAAIKAQIAALRAKPEKQALPPYLEEDFDAAAQKAKAEGKKLLVSLGREACGRCQVFYEFVKRGEVKLDIAKWVYLRLDVDNMEHRQYYVSTFDPDTTHLPYVGVMDGERNALKPCLTGKRTAAEYQALMADSPAKPAERK